MDGILGHSGGRLNELDTTVQNLKTYLEYSQPEVDLKKENKALKQRMEALQLEDKRTQFQVKGVEDKLDKLETTTKKKNLLFEGIPEQEGKRENVNKMIYDILDQLHVTDGINVEACYQVGSYSRSRSRPILVTFEKQIDRDAIYAKRLELKHSTNYQRVWINEDLGQASKRKIGLIRLIRLITKEAQALGIDCRSGKYTLHIDRVRYDDSNWEELPPTAADAPEASAD